MIQVTGIHTDPLGAVLGSKEIRITTIGSEFVTAGTEATLLTGSGGEYDFTLKAGIYTIEVKHREVFLNGSITKEKFNLTGTVELPESSVTTSLAQLLNDYSYTS